MPADLDVLGDLRRMTELQAAQAAALEAGDADALDALHEQRMALTARLVPLDRAGLSPAERAEAEALVEALHAGQARLLAAARERRDAAARDVAGLGRGRTAVAGYRPTPRTTAMHLDFAG